MDLNLLQNYPQALNENCVVFPQEIYCGVAFMMVFELLSSFSGDRQIISRIINALKMVMLTKDFSPTPCVENLVRSVCRGLLGCWLEVGVEAFLSRSFFEFKIMQLNGIVRITEEHNAQNNSLAGFKTVA